MEEFMYFNRFTPIFHLVQPHEREVAVVTNAFHVIESINEYFRRRDGRSVGKCFIE